MTSASAFLTLPSSSPSSSLLLSKAVELKNLLLLLRRQECRTLKHLTPIHARLILLGLTQDQYLVNAILKSYFDLGSSDSAAALFRSTQDPNVHLLNTMIRGFAAVDRLVDVTCFYGLMRQNGLCPNDFTFPFVIKASTRLLDLGLGRKIHTHVVKSGFGGNLFIMTGLVCFYAKCGWLDHAQKLFDEMDVRNVVSWTAIIGGYTDEGRFEEALALFRKFLEMDLKPDSFVLVRVMTACSRLGDLKTGEWVCRYIEEKDMGRNVFVATAIVDMYAKCGSMEKARCIFDGMVERDEVTWNTMVAGYSSNGLPKEALALFSQMLEQRMHPDCYTMVGVLSACARLGALDYGIKVSWLNGRDEFLHNPVLGTALIDMYVKCGSLPRAWAIFEAMQERDVVVWNAMISGLGMNGHGRLSFALFAQIEKLGIPPSGNTLVGLLCSCSHAGLVDDGRQYFDSMSRVYSLIPRVEHYGCMVDLLGRAGLLEEAHKLIKEMPMEANAVVWGSLLSGCRMYRDIRLAEHVLRQLIVLEPQNSGNYVLLSNLYSSIGRWEDSAKLRLVMKEKMVQKIPGCSWIEVNGMVHEFLVGDHSHPSSENIYLKLDELGQKLIVFGYIPATEVVLFDIEEEEKEHSLGEHSEKLAIAFGLINLPQSNPIRVVKNLRVCRDCHTAIKLISKVTGREIIVRDNNRFHRFIAGSCSCNDYW